MARQVPMTIAGAVAMLSLFVTVFLQRRAAHQLEIDLLLAKMGQHQRMEQLLTHEGDAIKSKLSLVKGSLRLREFEKSRQLEHDESRRRAAKERRVLVVYYVTGEKDVSKLQAFFELGFFPKMDDVEWVFVTSDADFDLPGLDDLNNVQLVSHKQEKRLNKDDMCCAWKTGVASQAKTFNYFIFLSSLSIGPFTPTYVPEDWVTTLIKTLTEKQNLLGPMVDCGEDTGSISFDVPFLITDKAGVSVLEKSFCSKKSSAQEEASRIVERFGDAGHRVGNLVLRWSSLDLANSTAVRRNLAPVHSSQVASACDAFRSLKEEVPLHPFEAMFVDAESESGKIGQKLHAALEKKGVMEDDRQWDNPWDAFEDELLGLNTN